MSWIVLASLLVEVLDLVTALSGLASIQFFRVTIPVWKSARMHTLRCCKVLDSYPLIIALLPLALFCHEVALKALLSTIIFASLRKPLLPPMMIVLLLRPIKLPKKHTTAMVS